MASVSLKHLTTVLLWSSLSTTPFVYPFCYSYRSQLLYHAFPSCSYTPSSPESLLLQLVCEWSNRCVSIYTYSKVSIRYKIMYFFEQMKMSFYKSYLSWSTCVEMSEITLTLFLSYLITSSFEFLHFYFFSYLLLLRASFISSCLFTVYSNKPTIHLPQTNVLLISNKCSLYW